MARDGVRRGRAHLAALAGPLAALDDELERIDWWGHDLAAVLHNGGRLLTAGNGGSAALAQHLSSELVGRYRDERTPLAAVALTADTAALTAIVNDYGVEEAFARQVRAHGRAGDVLMCLSTSGRSPNVLAAVAAARHMGMTTWALTGPRPNPLASTTHDALCVDAPATATAQEVHQVVVHLLCAAVDGCLAAAPSAQAEAVR
jgi:D-sedoheptulose 7-phosphate isomerase